MLLRSSTDLLAMAKSPTEIRSFLSSREAVISEHLLKVWLRPDHQSASHWCKELRNWIRESLIVMRRLSPQQKVELLKDFTFSVLDLKDSPRDSLSVDLINLGDWVLPPSYKRRIHVVPLAETLYEASAPLLDFLLDLSLEGKLEDLTPDSFKALRPDLSAHGF
jgi:hypothetical protein